MSDDHSRNGQEQKSWLEKITSAFSPDPKNREEVLDILQDANKNEIIDSEALGIIEGAITVAEKQVREVMVPRSHMVSVRAEDNPNKFLKKIIESSHSRFPVVGETTDDILGILLAKDLIKLLLNNKPENISIEGILRPVTIVPESKRLNVLLKEFRENRNHMAIVIDEYGGVSGLVTIEDVLEEIVGEIEDETDPEEDEVFIRKVAENDFIVKALTPIEEFNECFKSSFDEGEFDTIGGIIMQSFGHMPRRNEVATIDGFQFKVLNADKRQIHLLRIKTAEASN